MSARKTIIAMTLGGLALLAAACLPAPAPTPKPTAPNTPVVTVEPSTSEAVPTVPPTAEATVTPAPATASLEEDCMALCHIPDPNDYFGAGAKPLPASHVDRTTCLNCHSTGAAPQLPSDHLGRLDEACRGCHK